MSEMQVDDVPAPDAVSAPNILVSIPHSGFGFFVTTERDADKARRILGAIALGMKPAAVRQICDVTEERVEAVRHAAADALASRGIDLPTWLHPARMSSLVN